jgi:DNA-binding response OmpR family regulator
MLNGSHVLLVEDEPLVAEHIADLLTEAEASVVGPCRTLSEARQLVRLGTKVDAALLDLNLADGSAAPLLEALCARGIPTVIYTGAGMPEPLRKRHPEVAVLTKPVPPARLIAELRRATRATGGIGRPR